MPRVGTFYLTCHRWHLRVRLAPYGPTDGQPDDINFETAIKSADPISRTFRDWCEPFAFARFSEPITDQTVEAALYEMKRLLWERDDVAQFVASLYARR